MAKTSKPPTKARQRRTFSPEFKAEAVRLCQVGDRTIAKIADDLDLTETALREWVRRAEQAAQPPASGALTSDEREELMRLRRDNKRLQMERDILKNRPGRRPTCGREAPALRLPTRAEGAAGRFLATSIPLKNMVQGARWTWQW